MMRSLLFQAIQQKTENVRKLEILISDAAKKKLKRELKSEQKEIADTLEEFQEKDILKLPVASREKIRMAVIFHLKRIKEMSNAGIR